MALGHSAACTCVECGQERGGLGGARVGGMSVEVHDGPPVVPPTGWSGHPACSFAPPQPGDSPDGVRERRERLASEIMDRLSELLTL